MDVIKMLLVLAERMPASATQCMDLIRHIETGDRDLYTEKAKDFIIKQIISAERDAQLAMLACDDPALRARMMRRLAGMTQAEYGDYFGIPRRTVQDWEAGARKCPAYLSDLMLYKLEKENMI